MATDPCLAVARALLLHGPLEPAERLNRAALLDRLDMADSTLRSAAESIGGEARLGLGFFDSREKGKIAFGPGAGLAVGVSLGTQSLRATVVDANGWRRASFESPHSPEQLRAAPEIVLNRIRDVVQGVLDRAFANEDLLVEGCLPLLGWSVAWPTPIDRDFTPRGEALAHPRWGFGERLDHRVRKHLTLQSVHSFALNDSHAAAIDVMHRQTHIPEHVTWDCPHLGIVLRIAGGIGAAIVIVEPPTATGDSGRQSGFLRSILVGGYDNNAGEIGHVPIHPAIVDALNKKRPKGLRRLTATSCSCTPSEAVPPHLEAYASAVALAARLDRSKPMHEVLQKIRANPDDPKCVRALQDIGALVGEALVGPVAMLNPATITLTGALAVAPVRDRVDARLAEEHRFGTMPDVVALTGADNTYARARGAALALIRSVVHRRMPELLDASKAQRERNVKELTVSLASNPLV